MVLGISELSSVRVILGWQGTLERGFSRDVDRPITFRFLATCTLRNPSIFCYRNIQHDESKIEEKHERGVLIDCYLMRRSHVEVVSSWRSSTYTGARLGVTT
jgi:hypothetical protein